MATATQVEAQGDVPASGKLMMLPLSKIKIVDGFNPRDDAEKAELQPLARSIKALGILQPVLVRPVDGDGDFPLTAGERRTRAAAMIGLMEIPALVRVPDERTGGLDDAIAENLGSVPLNPVQLAHSLQRLRDRRLTPREIATRIPNLSERQVRERLRILDLPETLWPKIVDKTIPLGAVEALSRLATIHAGLPEVAVARVLEKPTNSWEEPTTWSDLIDDPIAVLIGRHDQQASDLPKDVYVASVAYPLSRFTLSDETTAQVAELSGLSGLQVDGDTAFRFDTELVERARALGMVLPIESGHDDLIVGQDVADQLAADTIAKDLAEARARAAEQSVQDDDGAMGDELVDEEAVKAERRAQRMAELAAQAEAAACNDVLGIALVKHLSKVRVDARVLKILTAVDLAADLEKLAARGARYGFPGWVTETTTKSGVKREYLGPRDAARKAEVFLEGARTAGEIAGRSLALIAMARHADETAVARSNRTMRDLTFSTYGGSGLPWTGDAADLLDELIIDVLPENITKPIRDARELRLAELEEAERAQRHRDELLLDLAERAASMTHTERQETIVRLRGEHGYSVVPHGIGDRLLALAEPENIEPVDEAEPVEEPEEALAQAA